MEFTHEMIEKARQAAGSEELRTMAKEAGIELTAEAAEQYFAFLQGGSAELPDEALEAVAGGKGDPKPPDAKHYPGQLVRFCFGRDVVYKGKINSSAFDWVQYAWYYMVKLMDTGDDNDGQVFELPLDLDIYRTQVIG